MAGGLLEYSGLVTKTKAMRARLLGADDYTAISEYESVTDFIAFLREQPAYAPVFERHGEVAHRGQVEAVIRDSLYMDHCKLYRFSGVQPRRALQFVFSRYEINVIKNCLQSAMEGNGQEITVSGGFFERHADFDLKAVMAANSVQELIQAVTGTEYESLLKELESAAEKNYADYAFALDIYYYKKVWKEITKVSDKETRQILEQIFGTEIDWQNLMWMYRAKRFYSMGEADVKKHQIPVSCRLRSAETKRLLETETAEQFVEFVRQTAYFRGKQAVLEPEDELTWERVMIRTYEKICKKHPMSVAPVLRYLYEKEHEIDLLTTALEGIRYRIPPYEIRDLIFAM